ncbi:hypothetical protein ACU4GD_45075 [Cupriavidus basilensis]
MAHTVCVQADVCVDSPQNQGHGWANAGLGRAAWMAVHADASAQRRRRPA